MNIFNKFFKNFVLLFVLQLAACAAQQPASPQLVDHAFGFDARVDSKDSEILAYRYGLGNTPQTREPFWRDQVGSSQSNNTNGVMPLADTLYVKWRTRSTNEVFEDLVNLKSLLPADMNRQRIYFVVQAKQLFIYLSDLTQKKPLGEPVIGPFRVQLYPTRQIYPVLNK